jgi:hypothetical protein
MLEKAIMVAKATKAIYHTYGVEEGTELVEDIVKAFVFPPDEGGESNFVDTDFGEGD